MRDILLNEIDALSNGNIFQQKKTFGNKYRESNRVNNNWIGKNDQISWLSRLSDLTSLDFSSVIVKIDSIGDDKPTIYQMERSILSKSV